MEQLKISKNIRFKDCSRINGDFIAMGESEKRFVIFDWKKASVLNTFLDSVLEYGGGYKISLAAKIEKCAVAGWNKGIELYDFNGRQVWRNKIVKEVHSVLMLMQQKILIVARTEKGITCIDESGVILYTLKGKFGAMTTSGDQSLIFCYESNKKKIIVLNALTGVVDSSFSMDSFYLVLDIAYDNEFLAITGYCYPDAPTTTKITLVDFSGKWIRDFYHSDTKNGGFLLSSIKKSRNELYSVYWNNLPSSITHLQKMNLSTGELISEVEIATHYMRTFDENADYLINLDGKVYDLNKMEHLNTLEATEIDFQG
jgi:hypothetical protein